MVLDTMVLAGDLFGPGVEYHCPWPLQPLTLHLTPMRSACLQVSETNSMLHRTLNIATQHLLLV
ncbi:hypothetical protein [Mesorhizobium sp.]|uniref:hypothetical protein n=1 Tax=Mesorhizobium sp. TaxID=1871066 RepID=UPI000FE70D94|nr:hypothetical protein [Mesorhizobium sp.]RWK57648.1 MAG: hypothetical protein EOR48_00310 [Mesorhizobium sp.]TIP47378.1 MAG: hypothetical protein E5X62_06265 [Mesorhizobium sp.]